MAGTRTRRTCRRASNRGASGLPRGLKLLEVEDDERVPSKQAAIVDSKPSTSPPGEKAVMTPERQRRAHRPDGAVHLEGRGRL